MSNVRLGLSAVVAVLAVVGGPFAGTALGQDQALGTQAATSPGGMLFDGSVPGTVGDRAVNFTLTGAAAAGPVVASGVPSPGDADLGRPWVFFAALAAGSANPVCSSYTNPDPFEVRDGGQTPIAPELGVEGPDPQIDFRVTCGGETYDVSLTGIRVGPFTDPSYSKRGGYRIGMPVFYFSYIQRRWGILKVRVCRVGADAACFERPPGSHPGGAITAATNSFSVVQRRTVTAGGTA